MWLFGVAPFFMVSGLQFIFVSDMSAKKCQAELLLVIVSVRCAALNLAHNRVTRENFTLTFSRNRA